MFRAASSIQLWCGPKIDFVVQGECMPRKMVIILLVFLPTFVGCARPSIHAPTLDLSLDDRCEKLRARFAEIATIRSLIVKPPFVVASDVSHVEAERYCVETAQPALNALQAGFSFMPPKHPVTIVLFSNAGEYVRYCATLTGKSSGQNSVYGIYDPNSRTIVVNLNSGDGTIVHELVHALADGEKAGIPLWLNEGIASLHEHCRLSRSSGVPRIMPLHNWRLRILRKAIVEGSLPPVTELTDSASYHQERESLFYAHARYFCFYLHDLGLLEELYSAFRNNHEDDPTGKLALKSQFPGWQWPKLEADFKEWVSEQSHQGELSPIHRFLTADEQSMAPAKEQQ